VIRIAPPKQVAISFLQLMWVNLAYFQTVSAAEVYKAMDQSAKDFGPHMVVDRTVDAFTCWYNVKDVLHRLFLLSPAFVAKWDAAVIDLQRLILRRQETLPLLSTHGIVFELLNSWHMGSSTKFVGRRSRRNK
jgi:hypothetical protein